MSTKRINLLRVPMPIIPEKEFLTSEGNRILKDYLEQLTRTIEENLRTIFLMLAGGDYGPPGPEVPVMSPPTPTFLGLIIDSIGGGWYNFTPRYYSNNQFITVRPGRVLNLVDYMTGTQGLAENDGVICWKVSGPSVQTDLYVGVELFGRTVIGICDEE